MILADYTFRLEKWNTGRVFVAEKYSRYISSFGPVCKGTGSEAISGKNAQKFGHMICKQVGFGPRASRFVGTRDDYYEYLGQPVNTTGSECVPDFVISGATYKCEEKSKKCNWKFRNVATSGGTCVRGNSDVYVDCHPPTAVTTGMWSKWSKPDRCAKYDFFTQRFRKCRPKRTICPGAWLEVVPCGQCITAESVDDNYNSGYISRHRVTDYNYSYDYSTVVTNSPARKQRETFGKYLDPVCQCKGEFKTVCRDKM